MEIKVNTQDLITVEEAARLLRKHQVTIYRRIAKNKIAFVRLGGRVFIVKSEAERLNAAKARA